MPATAPETPARRGWRRPWLVLAALLALAVPAAPAAAQEANAATSREATGQLFDSIFANDLAAVQAAIAAGADIDTRNDWGVTALDLAVDKGYYDIAHYLLDVRNFRRQQVESARQTRAIPEPFAARPAPDAPIPPGTARAAPAPGVRSGPLPGSPDTNDAGPGPALTMPSGQPNPFDTRTPNTGVPAISGQIQGPDLPPVPTPDAIPAPQSSRTVPAPTIETAAVRTAPVGPQAPAPKVPVVAVAAPTPAPVGQAPAAVIPPPPPPAVPVATARAMPPAPLAAEAVATRAAGPTARPAPAPVIASEAAPSPAETVTPAAADAESPSGGLGGLLAKLADVLPDNPFAAEAAPDETTSTPAPIELAALAVSTAATAGPPATNGAPAPVAPPSPILPVLNARLGDGIVLGQPRGAAGGKRCVEKRQGKTSFCVEPVSWPAEVAPAFDVSTVMYQGRQAIVRYDGATSTAALALFARDGYDRVAAWGRDNFGAPTSSATERIAAPGEAPLDNETLLWRGADPASGQVTTLEIRRVDNLRSGFPDRQHGLVRLYREGGETIFPQLSTMDLMLLR